MKKNLFRMKIQRGATLIEVFISLLILSVGMLSLGALLSFTVLMPKLSGYRATAAILAASHIERMRANPGTLTGGYNGGFSNGDYDKMSYDGTFNDINLADCAYPTCTESGLAKMDNAAGSRAVRMALPAGGMLMRRDNTNGNTSLTIGNLWIIWQEPNTNAAINPSVSDNCPAEVTLSYVDPAPRCIYVRFKL